MDSFSIYNSVEGRNELNLSSSLSKGEGAGQTVRVGNPLRTGRKIRYVGCLVTTCRQNVSHADKIVLM